ncbi:acyltransferase family protein [Tundrisphaera sp. TA3]|uniref:acyltransferase family protein n=1 Tax=Tundrisphaera sp. TA3 TaxID=3435775 RepID=UPI003EB76256
MSSAIVSESAPNQEHPSSPPRVRLASLDVFRGLTVAAMILVNNPGSWSAIYPPLKHAEWDGWTPTDLVFPFFLFIVGVSITFALSRRLADPSERAGVVGKIVRRSIIIFGVGVLLSRFPFYHEGQDYRNLDTIRLPDVFAWLANGWKGLRIPGVLARIAVVYLVTALIFLRTRPKGQMILAGAILLGYWALLTLVPVPGYGAGDLRRGHDITSYVDRALMPGHLYKKDYDPEGLLSTLPAVATCLSGVLAGHWLRSGRDRYEIAAGLFVAGLAAILAGTWWGAVYPINKALWTSSYVLLSGGLALQGLAACYWLIDVQGHRKWAGPFLVFGANPLSAFVLAGLFAKLSTLIKVAGPGGKPVNLHKLIMDWLSSPSWMSPLNASLAYALLFLASCWLVIGVLHMSGVRLRA